MCLEFFLKPFLLLFCTSTENSHLLAVQILNQFSSPWVYINQICRQCCFSYVFTSLDYLLNLLMAEQGVWVKTNFCFNLIFMGNKVFLKLNLIFEGFGVCLFFQGWGLVFVLFLWVKVNNITLSSFPDLPTWMSMSAWKEIYRNCTIAIWSDSGTCHSWNTSSTVIIVWNMTEWR